MSRWMLVAGTLSLAVACGRTATEVPDAGGHATAKTLTPEDARKVLAKVGDKTITLGDYVATIEHMDPFDRLRYQSPERRKELLKEMINMELLAKEAVEKGYDKDPVALQEERAILRDAVLREARKGMPQPEEIPLSEVKAYYDAHASDYKDPERRRLSAIVLKSEESAKGVLEQAKRTTSAAEWGELVRAKSLDSQAKANVPIDLAGDFGFVSPPGDARGENQRVPEEVRKASFEIGKVGDVLPRYVRAGDKYYVVRLAQKSEPHERQFAEAERILRVKLSQDKLRAREEELLKELRAEFKVEIDDEALSQVRVDLPVRGPSSDAGRRD